MWKEKPITQSFIPLKMVQRKVANNRKLGIVADNINTLKTEKKQDKTQPSLQNLHDGYKSQGADLKGVQMKKSRSIQQSDVEVSFRLSPQSGYETPRQPGKPPTRFVPSPKRLSSGKSPCISPNYMKSTSSFDARKEETTRVSSIPSSSKPHKVAKKMSKTSGFRIGKTLSKTPSFRHSTRTTTCSSTLKESKFPRYLKLQPGGTDAKGRSVLRVCSYHHCSLNGDYHNPAPPLKRFISSRRWQLKIQGVNRSEVLSPRKVKNSELKGREVQDPKEDFFVEIYDPNSGVDTQVSESLSDGPCSEIDFQDNLDQSEDNNLSESDLCPGDEEHLSTAVRSNLDVESSPRVSLDEIFCKIEWEEENMNDNRENYVHSDYDDNDQGKPDFETDCTVGGYLEESYEYPPYFHDEIVEYLCFSDADSLPESECIHADGRDIEEPVMVEKTDETNSGPNNEVQEEISNLADEVIIQASELEEESADSQGGVISYFLEEITKAQIADLDSYQELVETDGDKSKEDKYTIRENKDENAADTVQEERELIKEMITNIPPIIEKLETSGAKEGMCMSNNDDRDDTEKSENLAALAGEKANEDTANNCVSTRSETSGDENESSEFKFDSNENNVEEEKTSGNKGINRTEEARKCNSKREPDVNQELLDNCNKLKRGMRCKKADDVDEEREFNPRGPNFLDIEPDPEAEKVDLRHQEMDDRRNAEEWMIDHALQKTVNLLAHARRMKVELLVEAFEAVLPVTKEESSVRRNSLGSDQESPIQANN